MIVKRVFALIWGVLISLIGLSSNFLAMVILLPIAWFPTYLMFRRAGETKSADGRAKTLMELAKFKGDASGNGNFFYTSPESGIAINCSEKLIAFSNGAEHKCYPFSDIREWTMQSERAAVSWGTGVSGAAIAAGANKRAARDAKANTGLFVRVKDIDHPLWPVYISEKKDRDRWYEILEQAVNEGLVRGSAA